MDTKSVLQEFAAVLAYPSHQTGLHVRRCETLVQPELPEPGRLLRGLASYVDKTATGNLEEQYTGFFDLNPLCNPYVGYQLFGESYKRSAFLLALKEQYRTQGFEPDERELPDRLSVVLRFLASCNDEDLVEETIREGVLPAVARMGREGNKTEAKAPVWLDSVDPELEGHSHGEVLSGGYLLSMGYEGEARAETEDVSHPYRLALRALRLVLESLVSNQNVESEAGLAGR